MIAALFVPAALAPQAFGAPCATSLDDPSGLEWDFENRGAVLDGEDNAYESMGVAYLSPGGAGSYAYVNPDPSGCTLEDSGREIAFPRHENINSFGLDVVRKVYVPATGPSFARCWTSSSTPRVRP